MLKTDPIMTRVSRSTDPNVLYNEVLEIFKYQPVKHHTITVAERIKQKYMDRLGGKFKKREGNEYGQDQEQKIDSSKAQNSEPLPSTDIPSPEFESDGKKLKKKKKRKSRQEEIKEFTETEPKQESQHESPKDQVGESQHESPKDQVCDPHEIQPVKVVSLSKIKQKIPMMFASSDPKQDIFEWKDANQNEPGWTPITKDHLLKLPTIACPDEKTWNYFQQSTFKFEPYILVPIQKTLDESKQYFVAKMKN